MSRLVGVGVGRGTPTWSRSGPSGLSRARTWSSSRTRPGTCCRTPDWAGPRRSSARAHLASAGATVQALRSAASVVAFATIGDPSACPTVSYRCVHAGSPARAGRGGRPGITAMRALAAASRTPLVEEDEVLAR